jgi:hypothetical protein
MLGLDEERAYCTILIRGSSQTSLFSHDRLGIPVKNELSRDAEGEANEL